MIDQLTKQDIICDLANDVKQSDIVKKHRDKDISQQSISYLKKQNAVAIESLRGKILDKLAKSFITRAVMESSKADRIVEHYNNETLDLPDKEQASYLARLDNKVASQLKGILSPHAEQSNISIVNNESVTNIESNVLKMFQAGAKTLHDVREITALPD